MADKQAQAMERLTAKLTALRLTLRGEERMLLDSMVLAARAEVTAHSKVVKPAARASTLASGSKSSEMELHSANVRRADAGSKSAKASARKSEGTEATKSMEAEGRVWMGITLEGGAYKASVL